MKERTIPFKRLAVEILLELQSFADVASAIVAVVGAQLIVQVLVLVQPHLSDSVQVSVLL